MRIYRNEHAEAFAEKERKYSDLVWYSRSRPKEDTDYWDKVPDHIREGAFNAQARVQEIYPDEVAKLNGELPPRCNAEEMSEELRAQLTEALINSDWENGFNSGCLAAFRYVHTALQEDLGTAEEEFPSLDT